MSNHRLAQVLRDAKTIVQAYTMDNPKWTHRTSGEQDPNGAHALLIEIDAALASLAPAAVEGDAVVDAACEVLRKDAERYRWLRDKTAMKELFSRLDFWRGIACGLWPDRRMKEELDAAIDSAIAAGNGEGV